MCGLCAACVRRFHAHLSAFGGILEPCAVLIGAHAWFGLHDSPRHLQRPASPSRRDALLGVHSHWCGAARSAAAVGELNTLAGLIGSQPTSTEDNFKLESLFCSSGAFVKDGRGAQSTRPIAHHPSLSGSHPAGVRSPGCPRGRLVGRRSRFPRGAPQHERAPLRGSNDGSGGADPLATSAQAPQGSGRHGKARLLVCLCLHLCLHLRLSLSVLSIHLCQSQFRRQWIGFVPQHGHALSMPIGRQAFPLRCSVTSRLGHAGNL